VKWIQDYEDEFTEISLPGQKTWNDDDIKKRQLTQNAQNIGLVDTVFEESVSDKKYSFTETCNLLRSHAIRHDQQTKENTVRQIHGTNNLQVVPKRLSQESISTDQ
jgi:tRNA U34 5-carboxymethylaminomethyl modifying enzyme MnmG/GidA